jgi:hypothetical protein
MVLRSSLKMHEAMIQIGPTSRTSGALVSEGNF